LEIEQERSSIVLLKESLGTNAMHSKNERVELEMQILKYPANNEPDDQRGVCKTGRRENPGAGTQAPRDQRVGKARCSPPGNAGGYMSMLRAQSA